MIVDRIEGDIAVVEVEKGQMRDVPLTQIEGRARDGAVLIAQNGGYAVDEAATARRLDAVNAKRQRVFRQRSGARPVRRPHRSTPDVRTVDSAFVSLLHLASGSLGGIDPNHTKRSLAGLDDPSRAHGLIKKYGDPERMTAWNYLEPASFGGVISLKLICERRQSAAADGR